MIGTTRRTVHIADNETYRVLPGTFRNFDGHPNDFEQNWKYGYFWIEVTEDKGHELETKGAPVKWSEWKGDNRAQLKIIVKFDMYPPTVDMMVDDGEPVSLDKESIAILNDANITGINLDLSLSFGKDRYGVDRVWVYLQNGQFTIASSALVDER